MYNVKDQKMGKKWCQVSLLSNRTQNDLIKVVATVTKGEIRKELEEANIFIIYR